MPTLIINGSTREAGNTMVLTHAVLREIDGEKQFIHLNEKQVIPCLVCGQCANTGRCVLDKRDDMAAIRAALEKADRLLIASPLHFSSFTARITAFFSRLEPEWRILRKAGKTSADKRGNAGVILTGGALYPNMFEAARIVANAVFLILGRRFVGMVTAAETDTMPVENNAEALKRAANLGRKMLVRGQE